MEYLSLGPLLERTRWFHLGRGVLDDRKQALILGDGDGRFTQRLLARNSAIHATAVDLSAAMLGLLKQRCRNAGNRLTVHHGDARAFRPSAAPDLIVTHFFLDCLTQAELACLVTRLRSCISPGCLWLVSEFRIPDGAMRLPVKMFIRSLYFAFRILTGLRITRLPDHASALRACGFTLAEEQRFLAGVLTTQIWSLNKVNVLNS